MTKFPKRGFLSLLDASANKTFHPNLPHVLYVYSLLLYISIGSVPFFGNPIHQESFQSIKTNNTFNFIGDSFLSDTVAFARIRLKETESSLVLSEHLISHIFT